MLQNFIGLELTMGPTVLFVSHAQLACTSDANNLFISFCQNAKAANFGHALLSASR